VATLARRFASVAICGSCLGEVPDELVGKQEVKQSARVRADYYISCAFGLRSVGFVREGTPGAKVH
jgi:hypothetical protein